MFKYLSVQNDTARMIHEAFVSNNTGTTPLELLFAVTPWFFSFLIQLLQSWRLLEPTSLFTFLVEFILIVIPQMLLVTVGAQYLVPVVMVSAMILIGVVILKSIVVLSRGFIRPKNILDVMVTNPNSTQFCFLDNIRGHLCLITCMAILAVDFQIFPRRFAKTEYFGYGLMDTGVGFFMVVNGFLASESRKKYNAVRGLVALKKSLISSIPLLVIGFLRVIVVKSINYQEHVSEYGVHWNFFFSLVAAKIGSSVVFIFFSPLASGIVASVLAISYQIFLNLGLREKIFYGIDGINSRSNVIDANREGLCGSIGFTCLYLAGVQMGYFYFRIGVTLRAWLRTMAGIFVTNVTLLVLTILSHYYVEPASRRLINITYMLWMTTFIYWLQFIWIIFDLIDVVLQHLDAKQQEKYYVAKASLINRSMSYNFLLCFLIANVLTGLVNMTMDTISLSSSSAVIVMTGYLFVLLWSTTVCYKMKYQLKFW